jgi:DNA ligase-1
MAKREFLQKCHEFNPTKDRCANYLISEKLDGQRCFWDGGLTAGLKVKDVPFSNPSNRPEDISTGLWTINGKIVFAPSWWLQGMPKIFLDGELYTVRGDRQTCRSTVSQRNPDERWGNVRFVVFGSPPLRTIFADGKINSMFFKREFKGVIDWAEKRIGKIKTFNPTTMFKDVYASLKAETWTETCTLLEQTEYNTLEDVELAMDKIETVEGEGLVLQYKYGYWVAERSHNALKYKRRKDAEAVVKGYIWGEGKYAGLMGSLTVDWDGKIFQLSGFTDEERFMCKEDGSSAFSCGVAGEVASHEFRASCFPIGSRVTFRYRSLTDDGLPVEASYWRKYEVE